MEKATIMRYIREEKLERKVEFAADLYMRRSSSNIPDSVKAPATREEALLRAQEAVVEDHLEGNQREHEGIMLKEPSIDKSLPLLYQFQREIAVERKLVRYGIALGFFTEGTNITSYTIRHLLGQHQGMVRVEQSGTLVIEQGKPGPKFDRRFAELKREVYREGHVIELAVKGAILSPDSTLDTVSHDKKESLMKRYYHQS